MPLIDVIFLVLTFFIYAMVLMKWIDVLPVPLESYVSGEPPEPAAAVTVTIALDGQIFVDRTPIELDEVRPVLVEARDRYPGLQVYLVMADGRGTVDRGPLMTALWDRLQDVGLPIRLVGLPPGAAP